jgi:S-adenosylmethionine-diacylglycerol 3-amino-3-carboxypropyl transferase
MIKQNHLQDWVFRQVHTKNLVYNTCWEDPRCDRELMDLQEDSEVVMITSAGCNALDYLLDDPAKVHCIDMNPRQNALLEFKRAAFNNGSFDDLFQLFGKGTHKDIKGLYEDALKTELPEFAHSYWENNLKFFNGKGPRSSFYYYSTSGTIAWFTGQYFKLQKKLREQIDAMLNADSIEEQTEIYDQVESKISNKLVEWVFNRHLTMCLAGVPRSQQLLFKDKYEEGGIGFLKACMRKVFTQLSLKDNYFWKLYFYGQYDEDCCPEYLKSENFETISQKNSRIATYTSTISDFLKQNPGAYSHYVLLDHQDWLAENNTEALEEEWRLILQNSKPGTKILLRSAASHIDFFPEFVTDAIHFEKEKTAEQHHLDRVGTYASVYLGYIK